MFFSTSFIRFSFVRFASCVIMCSFVLRFHVFVSFILFIYDLFCKSGAMARKNDGNDDDGDVGKQKRKQQINWSQADTERLCELLVEHGADGILNKITNAATNDKKKQEWNTIVNHFNASPLVFII